MLNNRRLSDFLPIRFRDGGQVRQFSKPCIQCGTMLQARDMVGIAQLVGEHIAISARVECPSCHEVFSVNCLIDEEKQVRRVILPYWLFNPYLRMVGDEAALLQDESESPVPLRENSEQAENLLPETPVVETPPVSITRAEEAVGRYQGKPIPAWLLIDGKRFSFERIATQARTADGEFLLDDSLVYRLNP